MERPTITITKELSWLRVSDAAEYLNTSRAMVYKFIHSGTIKAELVGCQYRISAEEVQRYIADSIKK